MNVKGFVVGSMTVLTALSSYILPSLTGRTQLTKLQIAAIIVGGFGVFGSTVKALLTDPKPS